MLPQLHVFPLGHHIMISLHDIMISHMYEYQSWVNHCLIPDSSPHCHVGLRNGTSNWLTQCPFYYDLINHSKYHTLITLFKDTLYQSTCVNTTFNTIFTTKSWKSQSRTHICHLGYSYISINSMLYYSPSIIINHTGNSHIFIKHHDNSHRKFTQNIVIKHHDNSHRI